MSSLSIRGIDEPPTSPDEPAYLAYLKSRPSSGPFPSDTANNYYSAIKSTNPNKASTSGSARKKKTLSTLIAEALTVSTTPRSPKMEEEPGHIPPVTSFQHDDDLLSTGSSVTMPTVLKGANSPDCSAITENIEDKPNSPGNTVLSAITEKNSVKSGSTGSSKSSNANKLRKVTLSPGSIRTEKASLATEKELLSPCSIKTDKAPSVITEKASVKSSAKGQKVKDCTPKKSKIAGELPPKPVTVKDFVKNKGTDTSLPSSLGIPELSKAENQTTVRSESPDTPRISNARAMIVQRSKADITTVRSMSPSLERYAQQRKDASSAKKTERNVVANNGNPAVDNIGPAIIITDLLNTTMGANKLVDKAKVVKETTTSGAVQVKPTIDVGQEVIMSPSMMNEEKTNKSQDRPKTTLLQRALSIGSRSVSSRNSKQSVDEVQVIAHTASKDSSKNPASDSSTAASTVSGSSGSISSNENKSQSYFSEAATECTMKASNSSGKPIGKSMSFSSPQKEKPMVKTVRSMSPSLSLRNKYLSSARASQQKDGRETISSLALRNKSLPPLAPKQQRESVTSKLESSDRKSEADDISVEVVGVVDNAVKERALVTDDTDQSNSVDSAAKRRQKIKMGKLLRSRQELRSKPSLSSPTASSAGEPQDDDIPALESVASNSFSRAEEANTIQKEYTKALAQSGSSEVKSLTELIAGSQGPKPVTVIEKSTTNEMDNYSDLNYPVPISQIDFVADQVQDDTITLDPDLSNVKPKHQIWHENEDIDKPTPRGRYNCGAEGFRRNKDDSSASDDFLNDNLSYDGKKKTRKPLACGAEEIAEEIGVEMKYAATEVFVGVKKAVRMASKSLFGVCDITADGGVEYLADEMNATQKQLMTGEMPQKKQEEKKSTHPKKDGLPTADEALEQANRYKIEQRQSAYMNKRYQSADVERITIVERQEQARKQREEENVLKKKRHVQRLKALSLKHL
ncbi:hypothetical protein ACHAXN_012701 [Cyclotella atomus]